MADHTGSSQVADPSIWADPEPPLDRDKSVSDLISNYGSSEDLPTIRRRQPTFENRTLTIWFPLPTTVQCPHADCSAKFLVKVWTRAKQSIVRHLRDLHVEAEAVPVRYVGCRVVLGIRPGGHKCRFAIDFLNQYTILWNKNKCFLYFIFIKLPR